MEKKSFTTYQISRICDVYISTVIDWIESGKLPAYKTPGGHRRVLKEDLIEFLKKYNMPIPPELREAEKKKILIVEDSAETCEFLERILKDYEIKTVNDGYKAKEILSKFKPNLVILDLKLPGLDGMTVLKEIKEKYPQIEVIITTAYPSIKSVVETMRLGSYDYITKPYTFQDIITAVEKGLERQSMLQEPSKLRGLDALYEISCAMGSLTDMNRLLDLIMRLACETLGADGGSILLYDEKTRELEVKCAVGSLKDEIIGKKLKLGERVAGRVIETGEPILIVGSIEDDNRFKGLKKYEDIRSGMSVPLKIGDRIIGAINVKRVEIKEDYTEEDLKLLTIFAKDAALLIENARLHTEIKNLLERIKKLE